MFHLILTACLTQNAGACGPVLLPAGEATDAPSCMAAAARISANWLAAHPGLRGHGLTCTATPPALPVTEIAPGVFVHQGKVAQISAENRGRIANLGFILGADSVAVIDAGTSRAQAQELYAAIRSITDKPISHLILTHDHPDHMLGATLFAEAGTAVIGHPRLPDQIAARGPVFLDNLTRITGEAAMIGTTLPIVTPIPDSPFLLDLGDRRLELTAVPPAHTKADLILRDLPTGTLFTGDMIFRGLTPVVDGSINGWLGWMDDPPPAPARIVPGHGNVAANWHLAAQAQQDFLTALRDAVRDQIAAGASLSAAVPAIGAQLAPMADQWTAFDETVARDATAAYAELEWE
ncbi:MAG: quinoprotein relay system zinc metallohydrolase 2 [Paracoccus sp. (in: a-proteobacteria)]|uniref:quinoprotein relay system zinc metallohydrolase 2 n=1 Tax=Paracoccus sp. TaxID=267 RepID=UPI0026E0D860|nr:quinoprotein relay system zinc metallohydrolase 2 [Paracoccus sp. (in: a-proteobacteria)]MDO5632982.1 quinoprotein relay system zinc metallohydrolase 2 [Paracoccus sp. (in: a-proteobacteria)]